MVRLHFSAIASIEKSRPREEINVNNVKNNPKLFASDGQIMDEIKMRGYFFRCS